MVGTWTSISIPSFRGIVSPVGDISKEESLTNVFASWYLTARVLTPSNLLILHAGQKPQVLTAVDYKGSG